MPDDIEYAMDTADVENERNRLKSQGDMLSVNTEAWLLNAGVRAGASILEVGCGTGLVTAIIARLVGPTGTVVAIDRDANMADACRNALADAAQTRVIHGELSTAELPLESFDAIVGRMVLMYQPNPVEFVCTAASFVRPGGTVAFFEPNNPGLGDRRAGYEWRLEPTTELSENVGSWIHRGVMAPGTQAYMGLRLPSTFAEAGLEPSRDLVVTPMVGFAIPEVGAYQVRAVLPTIISRGIATAEEVDIDTLAQRMAEVYSPWAMIESSTFVGAYAVKPAANPVKG